MNDLTPASTPVLVDNAPFYAKLIAWAVLAKGEPYRPLLEKAA